MPAPQHQQTYTFPVSSLTITTGPAPDKSAKTPTKQEPEEAIAAAPEKPDTRVLLAEAVVAAEGLVGLAGPKLTNEGLIVKGYSLKRSEAFGEVKFTVALIEIYGSTIGEATDKSPMEAVRLADNDRKYRAVRDAPPAVAEIARLAELNTQKTTLADVGIFSTPTFLAQAEIAFGVKLTYSQATEILNKCDRVVKLTHGDKWHLLPGDSKRTPTPPAATTTSVRDIVRAIPHMNVGELNAVADEYIRTMERHIIPGREWEMVLGPQIPDYILGRLGRGGPMQRNRW